MKKMEMKNFETLVEILHDTHETNRERIRAVKEMHWYYGLKAIPFFIKGYEKMPIRVRRTLKEHLEEMLEELKRSGKKQEIDNLEFLHQKEIQKIIHTRRKSPKKVIRLICYTLLYYLNIPKHRKVELLSETLEDPKEQIRILGLGMLSNLGKNDHLIPLLYDRNTKVIEAALEELAKKEISLKFSLQNRMKNYPNEKVQKAFIYYELERGKRQNPPLDRVFSHLFSEDFEIREKALQILIEKEDKRYLDYLHQIINPGQEQSLILLGLEAIKKYNLTQNWGTIIQLLDDHRKLIRKKAIEVIDAIGDERHSKYLIPRIEDPVHEVRLKVYEYAKRNLPRQFPLYLISYLKKAPLFADVRNITHILDQYPLDQILIPLIQIYRYSHKDQLHPYIPRKLKQYFDNPLALKHLRNLTMPYLVSLLHKEDFAPTTETILKGWGYRAMRYLEMKIKRTKNKQVRKRMNNILKYLYKHYQRKTKNNEGFKILL